MKKFFSMIAVAIASVMIFTGCNKDESTEIVDPLAGKHEVDAVIHAEITGAFTKAVAIEVEYTDFNGDTHKEVVNAKFDGEKAVFDETINTAVDGNEKEASFRFKGIMGNAENYKSEVSPWGAKCSVVTHLDGNKGQSFYFSTEEATSGMTILKDVAGTTMKVDNAFKDVVSPLDTRFGDKKLIIKVGKEGIDFINWNI